MTQSVISHLRVPATVVEGLGLLLTAWRIYFRLKIQRFWWEDAWAAVLLLTGLLSITSYWIYELENGLTSIVASWIYSICFTCIVTSARMSVLFSIIRITHGSPRLRRFTYACVALFAASWVILMIEKVWQCTANPSWHRTTPVSSKPYCVVEPKIAIFEFVISILVALPLRMLWRVKLPRRHRRMILCIFASSVVLAFGAILHTVGRILNSLILSFGGMHVEIALSIIICNLFVVVTCTYRFLLHDLTGTTEDTSSDDDFTTPPRPPVPATHTTSGLALTTVDLEVSLTDQQPSSSTSESI
ncbi:hypothetical protein OG21DRAFT_1526702 [Imleria badia]|nr:hypothetical protein OG21DRAFT_1526702 [Imleria badia]